MHASLACGTGLCAADHVGACCVGGSINLHVVRLSAMITGDEVASKAGIIGCRGCTDDERVALFQGELHEASLGIFVTACALVSNFCMCDEGAVEKQDQGRSRRPFKDRPSRSGFPK